jgi:tetratricopeptide (TPR) repeat protein
VLFEAIGAEWARGLAVAEPDRNPEAEQLVQGVRASASPEQLASYIRSRTDDLFVHRASLLAHARTEVLAGRRDVEHIGRVLIAIGHLAADARAAGHFLVGYALRSRSDQSRRHFELADVAYRDLGAALPAGLAALAAEAGALGAVHIRDGVAIDGLLRAVTDVGRVDAECRRRLTGPVEEHIRFLRLAHELMAGGPVPSATFAASEDDLDILRTAMVGALDQPQRAAAIARWIQALRGLPADAVQELDQLADMLAHVRDWEPRLALLRDMIAHGDRRDETLIQLARTLTELRRWDEAKAELKARLAARPNAERIELLRFLVMTGYTVRDPETPQWARMLEAVGGELAESAMPPPTQVAEAEQATRPQRWPLARFENGKLTIDPAIPPEEVKEHMTAAMILGLGAQEGAELRDDLAVKDPALYEKVLEYLPAHARPASAADVHLAEAEQLFGQRRYREAIAEYQAALAADPDLAHARLGLGDAYYMLGEYRTAIAHFTESIAIRPTPQALRFLGDAILHGQSDPHRAKQCYEQALELDPGYGGARDALRQITRMLATGGADGR